jgi:RHS repeat-associated protein
MKMKTLRILIFGLLMTAVMICHAQITSPGWFAAQPQADQASVGGATVAGAPPSQSPFQPLSLPSSPPAIAEAITPQIQSLAQGLQNNWQNIFNYVNNNIRFVPYFGSKKGAQLTLLEKSGNDFDQCALLVALLRAAGYSNNVGYQFGWIGVPYDDPFGGQQDLHHWFQLSLNNTNWNYTSNYLVGFFGTRGYPLTATITGNTNTFIFQRVWVTFTNSGSAYFLDPGFKSSTPIAGLTNLSSAMGFSSNNIMSSSVMGGTDTTNYVSGLNETNLGNTLTGYATSLFNTIQSNYPNASVQQILSGQQIAAEGASGFGFTSQGEWIGDPGFLIYYTPGTTDGPVNWINEPTSLMSSLAVTFAGTNYQCWIPQLEGQRLSLTFDTSGVAQLWQDDTLLASNSTSGSSGKTNVVLSVNHPFGHWDVVNEVLIPNAFDDQIVTNSYQRTNATYALIYAFEPDWSWLQQRENKLDAYRQQGLADTSRQVVSETLNVMGLNWMLQTEGAEQILAQQLGILPQYHHRLGRMAQEAGKGYYVDIYMQLNGEVSGAGADAVNTDLQNRYFDLGSYFGSALENGLIEQLQSSNLIAASTVKMLEFANTNGQAVYLASTNNWSTVQGSLSGYDTTSLYNNFISQGYYLLLPQNGSNHIAGAGSWAGYGIAARLLTSTNEIMTMLISGGYNGGYPAFSTPINIPYIDLTGENQPPAVAVSPIGTLNPPTADPIDTADGTFQVEHTDLSLGQTEPRGITLSRYYNGTRRYMNPAGMAPGWINNYYVTANTVAAPQAALGGTTPAQAVSMIAATCAAIGIYNDAQPDPKNWMVTALIAKWGVDQMTKGAVSVNLGKDMLQFVRQPNGSFTPPPNTTLTLAQAAGGNYALQERHGRTFNFNASGSLTNIVDQYGNSLSLTYTNNLVSTITDWTNRTFTFTYNGNQLTSVSDGTRSVSYGYTGGDLTSVTDPEGKISTYLYDTGTNHEITATFDALNQLVVSNVYDGFGHVTTQYTEGLTNKAWQILWSGTQTVEIDPAGGTNIYIYDSLSRLTGMLDALGHFTGTSYDNQNHVVETFSPLNEINRFFYDGNNNLIKTVDPLNSTNQFIYDGNNNLVQSVDARGNPSSFGYNSQFSLTGSTNGAGDYVNYSYNGNGTLHTRTDSGGITTYGYDGYGQLNSIAYPSPLGSESFVNNSLGDVTSHTDGNGNVTTYQHNNRRQLLVTTAPTNLITSLGYDAVGNLTTNKDARGNVSTNAWSPTRKLLATILPAMPQGNPVVTNAYDARDWLAKTFDPLQHPVQFTNDLAGNLIATTDPLSRTTRMGYDADGRQTAITNAALEKTFQQWNKRGQLLVTTDNANHTVKRGYDAAGNQTALTNRNSNVWHFYYDGANRLTNTVTPLGYSTKLTFNHQGLVQTLTDQATNTTTYGYDGKGRLTNRTDNVATTTYGYDANNNLLNVAEPGDSTNSWTYDAYNRVSSYHDIYGNLIQYKYDSNGNVTNLIYPGGKNVYYAFDSNNHMTNVTDWANRKTSIAYDLAGRMTSLTRPNGTQRIINYDADGEATNIIEEAASKYPIAFYTLGWTSPGRVQWEFAGPLPHTNAPPARKMSYDADNRLLTFNSVNVTDDADGNLLYAPLTNSVFTNYTYDARNRLLNAGGVTNTYDAMNNRIGQTQGTNSTVFVVNPNAKLPQVLMRIKNGVTNYYVYGAGLLYQVTESVAATNTLTYHYDYRGSTVALTDSNGNITDRIEYSLYASTTFRAGTNDTPFLFNGRYGVQTDGNGLLYMRARYYSPYLCRFLNADPSGFAGGLNFYAYAGGNPVSYLDPFGLNQQSTGDIIWSWIADFFYTEDQHNAEVQREADAHPIPGYQMAADMIPFAGDLVRGSVAAWNGDVATTDQASQGLFGQGLFSLLTAGMASVSSAQSLPATEETAPQIFYRGDQAGLTSFQSYAAQAGGVGNSEAVLANGDLTELMANHAIDSASPPSPFISITTDPAVARTFAGPEGSVYQLQLAPGRAILNTQNPLSESEWLVPHQISPSEIQGTVP